tara:strand:+ start:793 stop:1209 length:417 start_codon:yes stop_codon:yes gene_type:complete
MVKSLITEDSNYDDILTNIHGTFKILPGQFLLLDNQLVIIDSDSMKIVTDDTPNKIFSYSISNKIVKTLKGVTTFVVQLKLDNYTSHNVSDPDELENLLINGLTIKMPTIIYIMYQPKHNIFTVKNLNMATLFMMKKM